MFVSANELLVKAKKVNKVIVNVIAQFRLITQAKSGSILKPILICKVIDYIVDDDPALLNAFLFSNEEIKSLLQKLKHA